MKRLIKILEDATEPDRALDAEIDVAFGRNNVVAPDYTFSIDTALTLVSDAYFWEVGSVSRRVREEFGSAHQFYCLLIPEGTHETLVAGGTLSEDIPGAAEGRSQCTAAIAVCVAALEAASQT